MNLDKLFALVIGTVLLISSVVRLDGLQAWVWRAQAKLIYESRTETWGSPRFFPRESDRHETKIKELKAKAIKSE